MTEGILYVAFGEDYLKLAEQTREIAKKFTLLPIHILTNVKDVEYSTYFDLPQAENRDIKTRMIEYSPFDVTLYVDIDAVFQHPFEMPDFEGLLVHKLEHWAELKPKLYKKAFDMFNVSLPIDIFCGGLIGFKKEIADYRFFNTWNKYWIRTGRGREMPALNCSIRNCEMKTTHIDGLFAPEEKTPDAIIQHDYGTDFFLSNNLTAPKPFKPFDGDPTDWTWV